MSGPGRDPLHDSLAGTVFALPADADSGHDRFDLAEAVTVLSNYDLGVISAVQEFRRGSRRSPKLLLKCDRGPLILKRLAPGRDEPARIAFAHELQRALAAAAFPLPALFPSRSAETLVRLHGHSYELFECVAGQTFDHSPEATFEAGATLGRFHEILAAARPAGDPPTGSYHNLPGVLTSLAAIPERTAEPALAATATSLASIYSAAAEHARRAGLDHWPPQLIHGDWHPGNLLFRAGKVVAVIDYDTARLQPRIIDLANGALQFSLTRTEGDPESWPDTPDELRLKRFCQGYDSAVRTLVSRGEIQALPWLMVEAMIAESALPIAATGKFGRLDPAPFLRMVERKARWIMSSAERISRIIN
ncbi:MAG: phosphotransferase [Planctomycetota bacterium]|nr:phosphotransferase [Planctomycetota bacterium]